MRLRRLAIACVAVCLASAQEGYDRDAYAREYVQFLVLQLKQWSKEFPEHFYAAAMQPPVDTAKLSAGAKAGAGELGDSLERLASLSDAKDIMTNAGFRSQLEKALAAAKEVNQGMASQRFPAALQSDWGQIRSTLNNLARVYKVETLAVLEAPGGGVGRGKRGTATAAVPAAGVGLVGYIVDTRCSLRGKGMWADAECVKRCVRDGDKIVLVTEEGKVYQIFNPDKVSEDSYGQVVTIIGKTEGDGITVVSVKM